MITRHFLAISWLARMVGGTFNRSCPLGDPFPSHLDVPIDEAGLRAQDIAVRLATALLILSVILMASDFSVLPEREVRPAEIA